MAVTAADSRSEIKVMGLIGAGHFMSHFYLYSLPALIPLLKTDLDVSYTALGFMITCLNLIGGVIQAPMGVAVDRYGAKYILLAGLTLLSASFLCMGFVGSYIGILVLAVFAGIGNSVIHPADYSILTGTVKENKLGRAFSLHTFTGEFGGSFAPIVMVWLATLWDWRMALILAGLFGLGVVGAVASQRHSLIDDTDRAADKTDAPQAGRLKTILSPAMLLFFAFFMFISLSTQGMASFGITGLIEVQEFALTDATYALTIFLFSSSMGVLLGGYIADRVQRQERTMFIAVLISAGFVALPAFFNFAPAAMWVIFIIAGLAQGVTRPARDMMVRAATPPGQIGMVFGFVSVGLSVGSSFAPVFFGWILDNHDPRLVFIFVAVFLLLMMTTSIAGHFAPNNVKSSR